ncbi:hypothetical protein LY90DRAFT_511727 [Neocallimastix californiae]|uniref:Uncharacterized protein n=1 Tax=Neocallimastix californiae TaxID=1754190 RepID=A0A1Y2BJZ9_9FUNG|nr:hypothetical protein LY90DRAFT_511727 [Neocallimastix californiae]|eukprot:ORY35096.1 hypothetical protein LY90DRAFT_511727 [Neocallimastix californiae]
MGYNQEQLQKINQEITNIWKNLCEKLNNKNPINFEIPERIINDFEGLIRNPNNGSYLNSYEWNIEKKYYCEFCNLYYHCKCINNNNNNNNENDHEFKEEIIQIENPVIIFKQAYNLNLSSNYLIHNADFKWCLQKKWICPNHSDKNPIPKPKLKHVCIPEEKKISSSISSPKHKRENSSSSTLNHSKKSVTHKKRKEENMLENPTSSSQSISTIATSINNTNININDDTTTATNTKMTIHTKKRSRNFSTTSSGSNSKPEISLKKRENILLKFVTNSDSSSPTKKIILSKKKNIKLNPDIDPNITIHLKNEDKLSNNIINKVIPKESIKNLKPEVKYKTTEDEIKMNFINKVYKTSKEMEEWLLSLILLHQDIMKQLNNKHIINKIPTPPSLNVPSTYLMDTLCSAIVMK